MRGMKVPCRTEWRGLCLRPAQERLAQSGQLAGQLGFNTQKTGRHSTIIYSGWVITDFGVQAGVYSET